MSASLCLWTVVAALTLLPRGALAQTGHWSISYSIPTGSIDWTSVYYGTPSSGHIALPSHHCHKGGNRTTSVTIAETATQTATLLWLDDQGFPAPNPPHYVWVRVYSEAVWDAVGATYSGTADNGQGDAMVQTDLGDQGNGISSGSHLRRYDGSSGVVTITNTTSASMQVSDARWAWGDVDWGFSVAIDNRGVMISSDRDPTYHKDPNGGRVQNLRDADGTLQGDTVRSDLMGSTIEYSADQYGTWTPNSAYHWYSSLTSCWDAGTFSPSLLPFFDVGYPYLVGTPGATDHVYIHLIDSGDGAQSSGNYYMHFHDGNENCVTTTDQTVYGPATIVSTVYLVDQGSGGSHSIQMTGTVSVTASITADTTVSVEWLSQKLGIQVGVTYTSSTVCTDTYNFVPGKYCWLERAPYWRRQTGTADAYDSHGYAGAGDWTADSAYRPQNPLADIVDHWVVSDTPPSNG